MTVAQHDYNRIRTEMEDMLSKFGWKWAVLASTTGKIYKMETKAPNGILTQLRMARTQIESGCYSICDIANELRKIEIELFSKLVKYGPESTDHFLDLLGKAVGGNISENDLDFSGVTPILPDCLTLPCVCRE